MTDTADRDNAGKPELSYLLSLPKALRALTRVFEQGAIKYERDNWLKGGKPDEEYLDSALRHILASEFETYDEDTGCLHIAHAIWNLCALIELNSEGVPATDPDFDQVSFEAQYAEPKDAKPGDALIAWFWDADLLKYSRFACPTPFTGAVAEPKPPSRFKKFSDFLWPEKDPVTGDGGW